MARMADEKPGRARRPDKDLLRQAKQPVKVLTRQTEQPAKRLSRRAKQPARTGLAGLADRVRRWQRRYRHARKLLNMVGRLAGR